MRGACAAIRLCLVSVACYVQELCGSDIMSARFGQSSWQPQTYSNRSDGTYLPIDEAYPASTARVRHQLPFPLTARASLSMLHMTSFDTLPSSWLTFLLSHRASVQMRVRVLWDIVTSKVPVPGYPQCRVEGLAPSGVTDASRYSLCSPEDVIVSGSARLAQLRRRMDWATAFIAGAVLLKPVLNDIVIPEELRGNATLPATVKGADLAVIMTVAPSTASEPFVAHALCYVRDQVL